jgi:FkbM family methyltransferase
MDLYNNEASVFTEWVVANKLLQEPFIIVDVGVQGGEHPRWKNLGEFGHVYGFDPIDEVIADLNAAQRGRANRSYRCLAIGNEDGKRAFHVSADTYGSSFFSGGPPQTGEHNGILLGSRDVEIRRLDSLFAAGELPPADYIKVDCEGFDPEVLRGAHSYLAKSNVLCVTVETNFGVSPVYPRTPFAEISDILVAHRLLVLDLNFVRAARPSYTAARAATPWPAADPMHDSPDLDVGQPATFDFVFCRDLVQEHTSPQAYMTAQNAVTKPTVDKLIKSMVNFELHGLMDCAIDIAEHFRPVLAQRLDVDRAIKLLLHRPPYTRNTAEITSAMAMIAELRRRMFESRDQLALLEQDRQDIAQKLASVRFLARTLVRQIGPAVRRRLGIKKTF